MSPRTSAKNEEIRQESAQNIMDAAFALISRQGYESTSISQIATEAGVSKGLLYNYFDSKEDLLQKLVERAFQQGDDVLENLISKDPAGTLKNIFQWFFREMKERPDHWKMMTELTFKIEKFQFIHDMASLKMKGYIGFIESLLRQLGFEDPIGESRLLAALFDGIAVQYMVVRDEYPLDEVEKYLIDKYCHPQ